MEWAGVAMIVAVLVVGTAAGLLRRRLDGRLRDVSAARRRLAELTGDVGIQRPSPPEVVADAAAAASNATAAAVGPAPSPESQGRPARALRLVRDRDPGPEGEALASADEPEMTAQAASAGDAKVGGAKDGGAKAGGAKAGGAKDGDLVPDVREEPGVVEQAVADDERLGADLLGRLGVGPAQATLLQFSSAFCAPCRAVRRIGSEVAALLPGVQHVEVDAESHLAEVRELGIWRTPTVLLLDAEGRVTKRATGVPSKPQLIAALADILPTAT